MRKSNLIERSAGLQPDRSLSTLWSGFSTTTYGMEMNMRRSSALTGAIVLLAAMVMAQVTADGQGGRGQGEGGTAGPGGAFGGKTPTSLRAIPAETTAAKARDAKWQAPRTPWGHPDLEGMWTSDDMRSVQLSRAAQYGTRESLTPEEFARRASGDEGSRDRAVNQETILRNEFGVRTFGYTSLVVDPPNGQIPAMTPAGRARAANRDAGTFGPGPFDTFEDFTLYDRCITRGVVGSILPVLYGNGVRILQTPNEIVLSYEMVHDTRVIPIDPPVNVGSGIKQYMGSSRGHWEGDTLVIETSHFTDRTSIGPNGNGTRHSDQMKMTEWLTRTDPEMIDYRIRVDDPVTYTAPFTLRLTITSQPGYEMYEYSCHEGNGAVKYALSADREYDRQVAEAKAKGLPIPARVMGMAVYTGQAVEGREEIREFGGAAR
jgi:hypothetical protein